MIGFQSIEASEGGGGTVAITTDRTTKQVAPDSVRFGVDLSSATFDTTGPAGTEVYDARLHDLIFIWDTGDTGTWSAPTNVLSAWNDKSRAKGPWFSHCYTAAGEYTVTLTVIEPSSGKTASDSVTFNVGSADSAYPTTQTICINAAGYAGANTWGPTGAAYEEWNSASGPLINDQTWFSTYNTATDRRFLFDPAQTYSDTYGLLLNDTVSITHPFVGSAGSGRARLECQTTAALPKMFYIENTYSKENDFRIDRIDAFGTYDPTTEHTADASASGKAENFVRALTPTDIIISDCRAEKFKNSTVIIQYPSAGTSSDSGYLHVDDTKFTSFGGQYGGVFIAEGVDGLLDSAWTASGSAFVQSPSAVDFFSYHRATVRDNGMMKANYRCFESFSMDNHNAGIKLCTTPTVEIGHIQNLDGVYTEGGLTPLYFQENSGQGIGRTVALNAVCDGLIVAAYYGTRQTVISEATGVTLRNMLVLIPAGNALYAPGPDAGLATLGAEDRDLADYVTRVFKVGVDFTIIGAPGAETLAARCAVYNSTFVVERSSAQNNSATVDDSVRFAGTLTNTVDQNNLLEGILWPENATASPDGPLTGASIGTLYSPGFRGALTEALYTGYAPTTSAIPDSKPDTGSAAVGDATTGLTAYFDIANAVRTATVDRGCWKVSA